MDITLILKTLTETATLRRLRGMPELTPISLDGLLDTAPTSITRPEQLDNLRHLRQAPIGPASLLGWVLLSHHEPLSAEQLSSRLQVSLPRFPQEERDPGTLISHASLLLAVLSRADSLARQEQQNAETSESMQATGLSETTLRHVLGRPELWAYRPHLISALAELRGQGRALMTAHPDFIQRLDLHLHRSDLGVNRQAQVNT